MAKIAILLIIALFFLSFIENSVALNPICCQCECKCANQGQARASNFFADRVPEDYPVAEKFIFSSILY